MTSAIFWGLIMLHIDLMFSRTKLQLPDNCCRVLWDQYCANISGCVLESLCMGDCLLHQSAYNREPFPSCCPALLLFVWKEYTSQLRQIFFLWLSSSKQKATPGLLGEVFWNHFIKPMKASVDILWGPEGWAPRPGCTIRTERQRW